MIRITPSHARLWLVAWLVVAAALTLTPVPAETRPPILVPLTGILLAFEQGGAAFGVVQVVGNLLLLLPVGALLPAGFGGVGLRHVLVAGLAVSLGIELVQWGMGAGRQPDVDDVWMNTLGAAAGWWLTSRTRGP